MRDAAAHRRRAARTPTKAEVPREYDAFICHASEDKPQIVDPIARALDSAGVRVWYDRVEIGWGESLTAKINAGLHKSRFVIVVLTEHFMRKSWPRRELDASMADEADSGVVRVLPVIAGPPAVRERILSELPILRDKVYLEWRGSPDEVMRALLSLLSR